MSFKNKNDKPTLETNTENKKMNFQNMYSQIVITVATNARKKATMAKHKNNKHIEKMWTCKQCNERFESSHDLQSHIVQEHDYDKVTRQNSSTPSKDIHDLSFVFSESMLDEFIDRYI